MINDERLLNKLKQRNQQAFKVFYNSYYKLVFYQAYSILNNKEDAEDASQNTFIKFIKNIESINLDASLKSIITHLAKNEAIDIYRKNQRKKEVCDDTLLVNASSLDDNKKITIDFIQSILDQNSSKIVILKILYSYSFQEIANDLNLTLGTVQGLYYKSIETLKKKYQEVY